MTHQPESGAARARYWEDFTVGRIDRYGAYRLERAEIRAFDAAYGVLPRPCAARTAATPANMGDRVASVALLCAVMMRLLVDDGLKDAASRGSPGIERARWLGAARAGDVLSLRQEVSGARVLASRPDLGLVVLCLTLSDQRGAAVAEVVSNAFFRRRPGGA